MIEQIIVKAVAQYNKSIVSVIENQNGVHPNHVFCLVGFIDQVTTSEQQTSKSSTGKTTYRQNENITLTFSFQGELTSDAYKYSSGFRFWLRTEQAKSFFRQQGYCYYLDDRVIDVPVMKDTKTYIRYVSTIKLNCVESVEVEDVFIESINNIFINKADNSRHEFVVGE